jgi:hypothetical protein
MLTHAADAYGVLENLVLVAGVHDNNWLQLSCFGDHASMETRVTRVHFQLKNCEHAGLRSSMRSRHDSMSRHAATAGTCGHVEQAAAVCASSRKAR